MPMQAPPSLFDRPPLVMVVEDNVIWQKILGRFLWKLKLPYVIASNGAEATAIYARCWATVRCILMDIAMPVMDGLEATARIRTFASAALPGIPPVRIVALCAHPLPQTAEMIGQGFDAILTKPISMRALDRTMSEMQSDLAKRAQERAGQESTRRLQMIRGHMDMVNLSVRPKSS